MAPPVLVSVVCGRAAADTCEALIAAIYALCRFYWDGNYLFSMQMFEAAIIPLILLSVPYIVWLDRYLVNPRDGVWHFGAWIAGRDDHVRACCGQSLGAFVAYAAGSARDKDMSPGKIELHVRCHGLSLAPPLVFDQT